MKTERPLTMTIVCRDCTNQFGAWRAHCPACGTLAPRAAREALLQPHDDATTPKRVVRAPRVCETSCTFCFRRGAKDRCPHCNELIHKNCQGLHNAPCLEFQVQRLSAINALDNTDAIVQHVNKIIGGRS